MRGNFHAQFLEGWTGAIPSGYSVIHQLTVQPAIMGVPMQRLPRIRAPVCRSVSLMTQWSNHLVTIPVKSQYKRTVRWSCSVVSARFHPALLQSGHRSGNRRLGTVGQELGARYVMEGSVRLTAQARTAPHPGLFRRAGLYRTAWEFPNRLQQDRKWGLRRQDVGGPGKTL